MDRIPGRRMMRRLALGLVWLIGMLVMLALFADIDPDWPLLPQQQLELDPAQLQSQAKLEVFDDRLLIKDAPPDGSAFVVQSLPPFEAREFDHAQLVLEGVGVEMRGFLVWQVDGQWRSLQLPGRPDGSTHIDLRDQPTWEGSISVLGFTLAPTDYLAAQHLPPLNYAFHRLVLSSPSQWGAIQGVLHRWWAYRPWNGRSNNTQGFEFGPDAGPSLTLFVFLAVTWGVVCVLIGGTVHRRQAVAGGVVVALLSLSGWQTAQLAGRAQVSWTSRQLTNAGSGPPMAALPPLADEVRSLAAVLNQNPPPQVLVWSENGFYREYSVWWLRGLNAAALIHPPESALLRSRPKNALIVVVGPNGWRFDADSGQLLFGEGSVAAERVREGKLVQAFRLREGLSP